MNKPNQVQPSSFARNKQARLLGFKVLLIALALLLSFALAFDPQDGTEIVLTDSSGETFLGYGFIEGQSLSMDISELPENFLLLVIGPDGSFETLKASRLSGGISLELSSGEITPLDTWLAAQNISFNLNRIQRDDLNEKDDSSRDVSDDDRSDNSGPGKDDQEDDDNSGKGSDDDRNDDPKDDDSKDDDKVDDRSGSDNDDLKDDDRKDDDKDDNRDDDKDRGDDKEDDR